MYIIIASLVPDNETIYFLDPNFFRPIASLVSPAPCNETSNAPAIDRNKTWVLP